MVCLQLTCMWAVVKTADVNDRIQKDCLVDEYNYYRRPSIVSSKNFRRMYDTVNDQISWTAQTPFCLAFEWMNMTQAEVPFEEHMQSPVLVANILKTCLGAFAELQEENLVYSGTLFAAGGSMTIYILSRVDLKPGNVLTSDIDGPSLEVKIGDLGLSTKHTLHYWAPH
jgi:hypothetical protein